MKACLPKDAAGNFIAEQERSDVVHDLLAFLAEQMLEMNKQKQQEIKGFLGWLEGYVGAKVEDLTPKTKLQRYYEYDYEVILTVLKKKRKKLAVDPAWRVPVDALRTDVGGCGQHCRPDLRSRDLAGFCELSRLDGIRTIILSLCIHHTFIRIMRIWPCDQRQGSLS